MRIAQSKTAGREGTAVALAAAVLLGLVAYRTSLGVSFVDDSYYVVLPLRIAYGARPFVDEMSLQSLGFLLAVPFVRAWTWLFGMTGLVLASRLFYVALAAGAGFTVYRLLRPSFRPAVAGLAAAVPLLAPPFNLVALSYNTIAALCSILAVALAFSALRDDRPRNAHWAGAATGLGVVSYPPLAAPAAVLLATMYLLSRDRRLVLRSAAVAVAALAAVMVPLVIWAGPSAVGATLAYARQNVVYLGTPLEKLMNLAVWIRYSLFIKETAPMWVLAVLAALPRVPKTLRAVALAALPLAAALPGALFAHYMHAFGLSAPSWLILFVAAALLPAVSWARKAENADLRRLLALAGPWSVVAFFVMAYATSTSWRRAVPVIGLTPLALAVVAAWASQLSEETSPRVFTRTVALPAATALALLFTTTFDDARPLRLSRVFRDGPYAGMRTSKAQHDRFSAVERAGRRWLRPGEPVVFLGGGSGYLLVDGTPDTNVTWLYTGPSSIAALDYYRSRGPLPRVVFVHEDGILRFGGFTAADRVDPLMHRLMREYELVQTAGGFFVFVDPRLAEERATTAPVVGHEIARLISIYRTIEPNAPRPDLAPKPTSASSQGRR